MMDEFMENEREDESLLHAWTSPRFFRNVFYLLAMYPLGAIYGSIVVGGLAVGMGLSFVLIGVPLLVFMFAVIRGLAGVERSWAASILELDPPPEPKTTFSGGMAAQMMAHLGSVDTWKDAVYLCTKFPLAVFATVLLSVLGSMAVAFMIPMFMIALVLSVVGASGGYFKDLFMFLLKSPTVVVNNLAEASAGFTMGMIGQRSDLREPKSPIVKKTVTVPAREERPYMEPERVKWKNEDLLLIEDDDAMPARLLDDDGEIRDARLRR